MSIPTLITVTGTIRDASGPIAGRLVFASSTLVRDPATNDVMVPQEIVATVGSDGELSVPIPATNDPAFSPTGWTWELRPHFHGWSAAFSVAIPYDSPGATIDLSDLVPVPANGTGDLYALASHLHTIANVTGLQAALDLKLVAADLDAYSTTAEMQFADSLVAFTANVAYDASQQSLAAVASKNGLGELKLHGFKATPGAPASGTWAVGDLVMDSDKAFWRCSVAGTPGTWT